MANREWPLSRSEKKRIQKLLKRKPSDLELALFAALWSEHCSYKSTRSLLKKLPTQAPYVVMGPGEDAGIIAMPGSETCLVLAMESHNHPSQVLPLEGAATGVGGIVRDVSCMGAEVIGVADALRFGLPDKREMKVRLIIDLVVEGIWRYGNAIGVPNIGGDAMFAPCFNGNCLVNVVALGKVKRERIVHSRLQPSFPEKLSLIYIGKPCDYSGFMGAAFASADLEEETENRSAVQVPDAFVKNILLHANEDLFQLLDPRTLCMKDLGAAGMAGAALEMMGEEYSLRVDLEKVPQSFEAMPPEVVLLAETQERFLLFCPSEYVKDVLHIYNKKYQLASLYPQAGAYVIGEAKRDKQGLFCVEHGEKEILRTPIKPYRQPPLARRKRRKEEKRDRPRLAVQNVQTEISKQLSSPNGASRAWIYRCYDAEVKGQAVLRPGEADACVLLVDRERKLGAALSVDGNPFYAASDPLFGAAAAVWEAVRNVCAVGARPLALADCLNFGNPEVPERMEEIAQSIEGIRFACAQCNPFLNHPLPVITGNVSLYNETDAERIFPSPIVACLGVVNIEKTASLDLHAKGNLLFYSGTTATGLKGSLFAQRKGKLDYDLFPEVNWAEEKRRCEAIVTAIEEGIVSACHDVSDGGVVQALAEIVESSAFGVSVDFTELFSRKSELKRFLFTETGGFLFEVLKEKEKRIQAHFLARQVSCVPVGKVTASPSLHLRFQKKTLLALKKREIQNLRQKWAQVLLNG